MLQIFREHSGRSEDRAIEQRACPRWRLERGFQLDMQPIAPGKDPPNGGQHLVAGRRSAMEEQQLSKTAFARKLKTSRSQLDRLLDPENANVTLEALARAANAVGRELQLELR